MPTVGRILAAERVRQGLDLDDISQTTKLSTRFLRAIESDNFELLPGLVFARNFVRQYADALRLDPAPIVEQFNNEQSLAPAQPVFSSHARRGAEPARIRVPSMSRPLLASVFSSNLLSAFSTFVITLVVCGAALYAFQYWRTRKPAPPQSSLASTQKAAEAPKTAVVLPSTATASTANASTANASTAEAAPAEVNASGSVTPETGTPAPATALANPAQAELVSPEAATGTAPVQVSVSVNQPCWIRITGDGKVLYVGTLQPGDQKIIKAAADVTLRAGNAGALAVKLNGKEIQPVGPPGQIRIVTLTPAGAQVRAPTPEPVVDF